MENYIGVKEVKATPMSKELAIVSGYRTGDSDKKEGYEVEYEGGYKSWSPKEVFDKAYRKTNGLTFGLAIEAMKKGHKVCRQGWNGKGMFLWLKPEATLKPYMLHDPKLKELCEENGGELQALGTISMYTTDSTGRKAILTGWLASQSDMLSEDWIIVE